MLGQEARWIGRVLERIPAASLGPVLNVGSHTEHFRTREQPWIDRHVFKPLRARGVEVIHTDLRDAPGVDLSGDLTDPAFQARLRGLGVRSVLCCNVLEHIAEPADIAASLSAIVPDGGYVVVTVPHRFPYHPDPIDTMYRPRPEELAALFSSTSVLEAEIVRCGTWLTYLGSRLVGSPRAVYDGVVRRRAEQDDTATADGASLWSWSLRWFEVTCVALRRPQGAQP
jgi:hypothetical protein